MKNIKIILLICLAFIISSYGNTSLKKKGIIFFKGSLEEALIKAQEEDKYVFIDFYTTWCAPCKKLKRTSFKDVKVGDYYNKNFINISINAESKKGIELARRYGVSSYPTLIITDDKGRKKAKTTGFKKPYILINFGRRVVP